MKRDTIPFRANEQTQELSGAATGCHYALRLVRQATDRSKAQGAFHDMPETAKEGEASRMKIVLWVMFGISVSSGLVALYELGYERGYRRGSFIAGQAAMDSEVRAVKAIEWSCGASLRELHDSCAKKLGNVAVRYGAPRAEVDKIVREALKR